MINRKYLLPIIFLLVIFASCKNNTSNTTDITESIEKSTDLEATSTDSKDDNEETVIDSKVEETETKANTNAPSETEESAVDHYICYTNDAKPDRRIWISFSEEKALAIRYQGQQESINLTFQKEEMLEGGAHPTIYEYYDEMYEGKKNGSYKLIHSGVWDYVEYTRGKDGKVFKFTIDHDADPYGKTPCF